MRCLNALEISCEHITVGIFLIIIWVWVSLENAKIWKHWSTFLHDNGQQDTGLWSSAHGGPCLPLAIHHSPASLIYDTCLAQESLGACLLCCGDFLSASWPAGSGGPFIHGLLQHVLMEFLDPVDTRCIQQPLPSGFQRWRSCWEPNCRMGRRRD